MSGSALTSLTFERKCLNGEGSRTLVEAILRALGRQNLITPELRITWWQDPAYWNKCEWGS